MKTPKFALFLPVLIVFLAILACRFPGIAGLSNDNLQPSQIAPDLLAGGSNPIPGPNSTTVTITEAQVNQVIRESPQLQDQSIQNPQVDLQPGIAVVNGSVEQNGLTLPLRLEITITADGQGGVTYQVVSARLGPLPLPQSMRDQITAQLSQMLDAQMASMAENIYIEQITISDDLITAIGYRR